MMSEAEKLARIFKALSVETRVRIVELLKGRALCVGALSARLDVTQGAVSQHLRVLRDADLVVADKRGYYVHYRLNEKTLELWRKAAEGLLGDAGTQRPAKTSKRRKRKEDEACVTPRRKAV